MKNRPIFPSAINKVKGWKSALWPLFVEPVLASEGRILWLQERFPSSQKLSFWIKVQQSEEGQVPVMLKSVWNWHSLPSHVVCIVNTILCRNWFNMWNAWKKLSVTNELTLQGDRTQPISHTLFWKASEIDPIIFLN